jgi:hypothetical protein
MEPFVFTGAEIELVGETSIGYRHCCGAVNELEYVRTDETGEAIYRIVGVKQVPRSPQLHAADTTPAAFAASDLIR